ncbi:MAG: type I 3-dehydroquinate dehydratase [Chthoniobacterales bacterium]
MKATRQGPRIAAVIGSVADLEAAVAMQPSPALLFELRLDALAGRIAKVEAALSQLRGSLIISARHPAEGGLNHLPSPRRRALLLRFLPYAAYVDVELRTLRRSFAVFETARAQKARTIASFHDFSGTPTLRRLLEQMEVAVTRRADILKVATRVDDERQLDRLISFYEIAEREIPVAAMGIGKLGRDSRIEMLRRGSVLNYGYITRANADGQVSVAELRGLVRTRLSTSAISR